MKVAVAMPGKLGDALYLVPTIRHISKILDCKVDFWTTKHCIELKELFEAQSCINKVYVDESYVLQHQNCGNQPYYVEILGKYDRIYQCGLRSYPQGRLVDYYPELHGFTMVDKTIRYDWPKENIPTRINKENKNGTIVICPGRNPILKPTFAMILEHFGKLGYQLIQVGPESELLNIDDSPHINSFVDSLPYFNECNLFFGTLSANLVIANGFPCKKIVLCEKERHNAAHDIQSDNHIYLDSNAPLEEIIGCAT